MGGPSWRTVFTGALLGGVLSAPAHAKDPNTLTLATATPKDKNFTAWEPFAETVAMRHGVLGKWAGGDTWVLFFTNGSGEAACKELTQPTGDLLLTLMLPGPPKVDKKRHRVELSDATLYVKSFNAAFPLFALDAKQVVFTAFEDGPPKRAQGEIEVRGEHAEVKYEISGAFSVLRCDAD